MLVLLLSIIYLSFISLGLPDSMLGSAWPSMFVDFNVPVSYAGIISAIIAIGTVISSLASDKITRRLGAAKTTAISVSITALALLGFAFSSRFFMLCLFSIPYGLGAGSVDAALNNYVSLHFSSKHMSWLHCMWGVGSALGPAIMGSVLTNGLEWNKGYLIVSIIQITISIFLFLSLPIWKKNSSKSNEEENVKSAPLTIRQSLALKGTKAIIITFFCYCALEVTTTLWASSYLNLHKGIDVNIAALWGSLYVLGITLGRAVSGFVSMKLNDNQLTRIGECIMVVSLLLIILPFSSAFALFGLVLFGIGSAPIYPCIIHSTPARFGKDKSQSLIGLEMASAYIGTCLMPPIFGLIANHISISLFPVFLGALTIIMIVMFEVLNKKTSI